MKHDRGGGDDEVDQMHDDHRLEGTDEWTERIAALPEAAEVVPEQWDAIRAALEARTERAARRVSPAARGGWSRRWLRVAAAVTLLAAGVAGGFAAGQRHAAAPRSPVDEAMELAAEVQRTGSEYVAALAAFTAVVDSLSDDVRLQGRDAAIATLVGAATELAVLTDAELAVNPLAAPPAGDGRIRF